MNGRSVLSNLPRRQEVTERLALFRANDRPDMTEPEPAWTTFRDVRVRCYPPKAVNVKHKVTREHKRNKGLRRKTAPACRLPVAPVGGHKEETRCRTGE